MTTILLGLAFLTGCGPEVPEIDPVPHLEVVSITPTDLQEFSQPLELVLAYRDEDGDLGSTDPDEHTLHIQDSRLEDPDTYHIPPIAPVGSAVSIQGTLEIPLPAPFLLGNGASETFSFRLQIRDQAGNWSEPISTPPITVFR
ncbi:hypothetical protein [Pontibacter sp. G13]|uniref:hypothetical protein n=1 Tax=Pontibacter sp. G13 TaxID=3074898 RepID=UPI00288B1C39|nr:hypothetical protein [Pontibacter sp. G13]WNJ19737.1 hypothetical protein RJD25_04575 [Pontibacter sp. G13]